MKPNPSRWLGQSLSDAPVRTNGLFSLLAARQRQLRLLVILIATVIFTIQWVRAGLRVEDGDFYLHWQFACRFVHHQLLYADGLHIPYPPFWAMAWSPIATMSLSAAKIACYPLSIAALAVVLWILDRLTRDCLPLSGTQRFWATTAALAIVSRFLVRELPECGPNLLLLALSWSAIYLWTRHRDLAAGACLGFATALKCTPALLIAYFAWKRQWKLAVASVVAAGAFALAPALWQGPADYQRHVRLWLTHLSLGAGQTDPTVGVLGPETLQNLSLRPAIARWFMRLPPGHPSRLDDRAYVDFLDFSPATAGRITKFALLALLAGVAWTMRKPVSRRDDLATVWEAAAVGALALLLSPITWYQHCVALLPVFYLFTRTAASGEHPAKWMWAVVGLFVLIVDVLSRGVIGRDATLLLASYHLTTWAIFSVLILALGAGRFAKNKGFQSVAGAEPKRCPGGELPGHRLGSATSHHGLRGSSGLACRALVVLGIALRIYHYLRNPSLWHDEAALVINVLEKSFAELLGPLRFSEAAPPLFLWLEKAASLVFGESLFALRLLPLLASCAALVLFVPVAKRILPPAAAPWAVLLFAVSDRLLWHACEAKQYSIEALVAVVLMAVWLRTSGWPLWRRAALLAVLAPPLLCVAYPAAFLYGGLLIGFFLLLCQRDLDRACFKRWLGQCLSDAPVVDCTGASLRLCPSHQGNAARRSHRLADWLAFGVLCLTVLVTFGLLLAGPIHAQRDETIVSCWDAMNQFPDWAHPASVPGWIVRSTCDLVGYCIKPVGQWLAPLAVGGLLLLWRQGKREWCLLLAAPIFLALMASCIKAYPYGGMRVMTYAAPAVCLLVAAAVPFCLEWITRRHILAAAPLVVLLAVPVVRAAYCVARPWQRADCAAAAAYVEQHRELGERVTANHWEYLYYFRRLGSDFVPIEMLGSPAHGRLWLVVTGATAADRQPCLAPFAAPLWKIKDRREFDRTTVCLVECQPLAARTSEATVRRPEKDRSCQ